MKTTVSSSPLNTGAYWLWTAYAGLGLLIVALWVPRIHGPLDFRWDGGVYYVLGTSLSEGNGYRLLNEPGEIRANQYPPLLPLLIAAHQRMLGTSDPLVVGKWLRALYFFVFVAYIFGAFTLLRDYLPSIYAFLGTVVCLLNVHTYFLSDLCFPDLLYALFTIGFLLAQSGKTRFITRWTGGFAVIAFAIRTAGLALLAAWVGEAFLKKQWRKGIGRAVIAVLPVVAWFTYVHDVEMSIEYQHPAYAYQRADYMFYNVSYARNVSLVDPFDPVLGYSTIANRVGRYFKNVLLVTRSLGESVSSMRVAWQREWEQMFGQFDREGLSAWIIDIPLFGLGSLVLLGAGLLTAQGRLEVPLCMFLSIMMICLTPWPEQFNRYLMPTVPMLSLSLFIVMVWLLGRLKQVSSGKWKHIGVLLIYTLIIGVLLQQIVTTVAVYTKRFLPVQYNTRQGDRITYRLFFYMDAYRALDAGVDWLSMHAKPTDVIAVSMPHWVYLRTGNKAVMPPFESNPHKAQELLDSVPVTYLILDEGLAINSKRFTRTVIEMFPDRWKRVYNDDVVIETGERHEQAFEIYERVHPGSDSVHSEKRATSLIPEGSVQQNGSL